MGIYRIAKGITSPIGDEEEPRSSSPNTENLKVHAKNIFIKDKMSIILYNDKKKRARNLFLLTNVYPTITVTKKRTGLRPIPKCFEQFYKYTNSVDNHN